MELNKKELAQAMGVTDRTVTDWVNNHSCPQHMGGHKSKYILKDVVSWYVDWKIAKAVGERSKIDYAEQRARHEKLKADRVELDILRDQKVLIPSDILGKAVVKLMSEVKKNITNIPSRLSSKLSRISDETTVHRVLSSEIKKTINSMVDEPMISIQDLIDD